MKFMKKICLLSFLIFTVALGIQAQVKITTKIVDTINYLGYKKLVGSPIGSGVKLVPSYVGQDSIKVPVAYQKFKNKAKFNLKEIAIPMVSLNPKGATVSVKITHKETILEESILSVAYNANDITTYWFKFKNPISIDGDYSIDIQPNTYFDSIYLPTSGDFINSSIKANISGNKLTIVNSNNNIGSSFWVGQQISGNGITIGTTVTGYNSISKEYSLSSSANLTDVLVTGINKTFGSNDGGYIMFSYPVDKTFLPNLLPDFKATPGFSYQSLSWDAVKKESIYEHDFVMFPVVEYEWSNTPLGTAVCLGDNKTITITADKSAYDDYVANPFFNKSAFLQQYRGLGKSVGNFYGRISSGKENLKDTLDMNDSKLEYSVNYSNDNSNDTIRVIESIQTYGYTTSKTISQTNNILISSKINSSASVSSPILCNGKTATISVSGNGGFAPLKGIGDTTGVFAGNRSFFVTDANGCKSQALVQVTEPTAITISGTPTTESTCNNKDAKIDIIVSGANTPYTFKWSNDSTTQNISSLSAGLFTVTVTDKNNCVKSKDFIISAIGAPVVNATLTEAIKCFGGDAKVTVSVTSGGQSPFVGTGLQIGQKSGDRFYIVTDKNNCKGVAKLTISEPALLVAKVVISDSIKCNGGSAIVFVSATGGTTNYSGIGQITGVKAGSKGYTVTDANNCTSTANIIVTEPSVLVANSVIKSAINCHYGSGVVTVTAQGGTMPYLGIGDQVNVKAGSKSYVVTDGKGCVNTTNIVVTEPVLLEIDRTSISATNDTLKDGKAIVVAVGGTTPYSYTWKNNETLTGLNINNDTIIVKSGSYAITVMDNHGCTAKTSVTVDANHLVSLMKMDPSFVKIYPNPMVDQLTIVSQIDQETRFSIVTLSGQILQSQLLPANTKSMMDVSKLTSGIYLMKIENSTGAVTQKIEKL